MKRLFLSVLAILQFILTAISQPTIDGDMGDASYSTLGTFTSGRNGFGDDNDLGVIKYYTDNTDIYIGITGEMTSNDNIVLFFNFSGYGGRSSTLAGSGTCGNGVFRTSSNSGDYGLDGATMDMDIDFALAFNEGSSSTNFYIDAVRYGSTGILNCGYLGNTISQSGTSGSFNAGTIFGGTGYITIAYHNGFNGNSNKGIEFRIPIAAFAGVTNTQSLQLFAIITNNIGEMSNETIPGDPGGSNLGKDSNLSGISGQDFFTSFAALPVELTNLTLTKGKNSNTLHWSTATELNNSHFDLQRSPDSRTWETLGTVPGNGTTLEPQQYSYTDRQPLSGMNYYRLKQVDFDGNFEYSKVVSVDFRHGGRPATLSPNPVGSELFLTLPAEATNGPLSATIYDLNGKVWQQATLTGTSIPVSGLPSGLYFIKITDDDRRVLLQERFVKE